MENVFKEKQTKSVEGNTENGSVHKPIIKDLGRKFLNEVSKYSQAQKINLMYKTFIGKKPAVGLNIDQLMNRILYTAKFGKYIKRTNEFFKKKKNKFKWPVKWKGIFKSSRKKRNQILVWFLNIKGEIEPPKLYPIYSSNMVIIKSRPYEIDPRSFWRMGKYTCHVIKEIDRRPVSNLNYDEIKKRGDSTDSDEFLIKAALQAIVGVSHKKPVDKKTMIIIGIVILAAIVFFLMQ